MHLLRSPILIAGEAGERGRHQTTKPNSKLVLVFQDQEKKKVNKQQKLPTYCDIIVMAHSMGVISFLITSSVRSSGQWATKLLIANNKTVWIKLPLKQTNIRHKQDTNSENSERATIKNVYSETVWSVHKIGCQNQDILMQIWHILLICKERGEVTGVPSTILGITFCFTAQV